MTTTAYVRMSFGAQAPSGATVTDRTIFKRSSPAGPAGKPATLLGRMSAYLAGTMCDADQDMIALTFKPLYDGGVVGPSGRLDALLLRGLNSADSAINWAQGWDKTILDAAMTNGVNHGAAWVAKQGFSTDGVSSWFDANYVSGRKYALSDACIGAYVTGTPTFAANAALFGRPSGSTIFRFYPQTSTALQCSMKLNSPTSLVALRTRSDCGGFWHGQRSGNTVSLYQDAALLGTLTEAATALPTGIQIGNDGGTLTAIPALSAIWFGASLTTTQMGLLRTAIEQLNRVM